MVNRFKWTDEEINFLIENYANGTNFVSKILVNRTTGSIKKKAKQLGLKVNLDKVYFDTDKIKEFVRDSHSFADVFRKMNKVVSGKSYTSLKRFIEKNNIDYSHFDPWKENRYKHVERPITHWLLVGTNISSRHLKDKLYKASLKERKCELCGQCEEWMGKKMSLILDHINGINNDNRLENLRIVCPNCNATLDTHCRGHKKLKKEK